MSSITQVRKSQAVGNWLSARWFGMFLLLYGLWVWLPFFAPFFMKIGWSGAGKAIYFIYSFFCHQLPERSFFLFGAKVMYTLSEVQSAWQDTINPLILRQFVGNTDTGWKIAWSDRMVSFYTSIWIFAAAWRPFRKKIKPLSLLGFALFLLPIALDGGTHLLSDLAGIGQGFRDTNQWLVFITNNSLPFSFYAGDAFGSFNSLMRLVTGLLAGLGIVWLAFPSMEESFA